MRYADPSLCPDCRTDLPRGTTTCRTCGLLVRHEVAVDLFRTLQRADTLVAQLRALSGGATSAPREPVAATRPAGGGPLVPPSGASDAPPAMGDLPPGAPAPQEWTATPARPLPAQPSPPRTGVGFSSVPKILLGLGALCLLVAAVIFLAVSWSLLGVGGRTTVLVGLTAGATAASLWLHRHQLRIAAEALMVVALGLLTLDLLGAETAGWLGDPAGGTMAVLVGAVLAVAGTVAALPSPAGVHRLGSPQVAAALGLLTMYVGALELARHDLLVGHAVVVAAATIAWLVRDTLRIEAWSLAAVGALAWLVTSLAAFAEAVAEPDLGTLWREGNGWSLLASAAVLVVPGRVAKRPELILLGAAGAAVLTTVTLTVPTIDEGARAFGLVAVLVTAGWVAAQAALPRVARPVAIAPALLGSLVVLAMTAVSAADAGLRVLEPGAAFTRSAGVRLTGPDPVTEPLLVVPSVLVLAAFAVVTLAGRVARAAWLATVAVLAGVAGVVTLASYDVPLAAVVAALAALALAATGAGLLGPARTDGLLFAGLAVAGFGGVVAALPSAGLTAAAAGVLVVLAVAAHLRGRGEELRVTSGAVLPLGLGLVVWASGHAVDVEPVRLGVPVLLTVGLLAIARPRVPVEVTAAAVGALASLAAVATATDRGGALAVHLTVAGCLLTVTSLVHASRRDLAYAGTGLLFLATWVRLGDLGVTDPEPYTLPLATALTVVGLVHLRRHPEASTATALLPGLLLGTVPSLLWVLGDPVSLRALLLGVACLALAIAGATLRWSAPLLVGSAVGAAVVVRELGPYAGEAPQWVWIGLAGALLVAVGITWERRLVELRKAVGLLGRLR